MKLRWQVQWAMMAAAAVLAAVMGGCDASVPCGLKTKEKAVADFEREMSIADGMLDRGGFATERWGRGVVGIVMGVEDIALRRHLAERYIEAMEALDPLAAHHPGKVRTLYNHALLWNTYLALVDELDDRDAPCRLICRDVGAYRRAIGECAMAERSEKDPSRLRLLQRRRRELGAGLEYLGNVTNSVLFRGMMESLPPERREAWKNAIDEAFNGNGGGSS